jgi:hypothetical protein
VKVYDIFLYGIYKEIFYFYFWLMTVFFHKKFFCYQILYINDGWSLTTVFNILWLTSS